MKSLRRSVLFLACVCALASDKPPAAYVVTFSGTWQDNHNQTLRSGSLLKRDSGVKVVGGARDATLQIRLFPCLVTMTFSCSADPCRQMFWMKDVACVNADPALSPLFAAISRFFSSGSGEQVAEAITMSRAGDDDSDPAGTPDLQEAVLLVDNGAVDLAPLISGVPPGRFWLEFCRSGPRLSADCEGAPRLPLTKDDAGRLSPAPLEAPSGFYRIRLWKLSPRGPQPTTRAAFALVGPASLYRDAQERFASITAAAAGIDRADPLRHVILAAWLLENERK